MKSLLSILLFGIVLFGCEDKTGKVEVVPNLEAIYTSVSDVDTQPEELKTSDKDMDATLIDAIKNLYDNNSGAPMRFKIALRIYLNEEGTVDKLKDISKPMDRIERGSDSVNNYTDMERLTKAIAKRIGNWKFVPAKINDNPVKCWSDIKVNILMKSDGTYYTELPDFLKNIHPFNQNDAYYVAVEQMPALVGGIRGLQEKIRYPEIAKRAGVQGKVFILAYIDENGNVANAKVLKGIGSGCDDAALTAVKNSKFIPGEQRGKPVKVQVTVPISFKLSDTK